MSARWQLLYRDGRVVTEPVEERSIRLAPKWPSELRVVDAQERPIVRVELPPGAKPLFYRRRWMATGGASGTGAVIFGRAFDGDLQVDTTLWALIAGRVVDCPAACIDQAMIEAQVAGAGDR